MVHANDKNEFNANAARQFLHKRLFGIPFPREQRREAKEKYEERCERALGINKVTGLQRQLSTKTEDEQKSGVIHKRRRSITISSPNTSSKKTKIIVDDTDEPTGTSTMSSTETNEIPIYLSINNKLFVHMAQTITKTTTSISINNIQPLALFIHQATSVRIDREVI
ncbi:unnamed protein product [Rotaria socialis]|uniref:Uncharacterized protein n=1 Tax=Rotaria socialis TaxID=392032 RepID=A0A817V489_9BILA|nr:unnamed protein product [Rotaria socialis]